MEPYRTTTLTGYSCKGCPSNHTKPSITENRQNKAKYPTFNSIRLKFEKKTSMPNLPKALGISNARAPVAPELRKAPAILSDKTVRRSVQLKTGHCTLNQNKSKTD